MRLRLIAISAVFQVAACTLSPRLALWGQEITAPAVTPAVDGIPSANAIPVPQNLVDASAPADPGDVSGTVGDDYGDILPGATVLIEGSHPAIRQTQTTDDNGFFEF